MYLLLSFVDFVDNSIFFIECYKYFNKLNKINNHLLFSYYIVYIILVVKYIYIIVSKFLLVNLTLYKFLILNIKQGIL
jgi:hypothetical protein